MKLLFLYTWSLLQLNPVSWTYHLKKVKDNQVKIVFQAKIDKDWATYSQYQDPKSPVTPISFIYEDSSNLIFIGKTEEFGDIHKGFDKVFEMDLVKIYDSCRFEQLIELKDPSKPIRGFIDGMTCNDMSCIPFESDFELALINPDHSDKVSDLSTKSAIPLGAKELDQIIPSLRSSHENVVSNCSTEEKKIDTSLFWTFLFGFLGGLLALLTPCVFPLIPLTVSYFTKSSKDRASGIRNGLTYGLSIIGIYVGIGILITAVFGATALNDLSTNWIANLLFFIIFVVFAFSFFGFYEITLPSSWSTKTDALGRSGSLLGIFFMAFTLALVSFSCTGPIIGTALVQSATMKAGPAIVMFGFATALALPFGFFAAFPAWLQSLPKSGSWMNSVKVVLGFIELALAFKFLSVSDMTSHWGFLRYELFMVIWIICFGAIAAYLFGWIKFPHDSPLKKLSLLRLGFAGLSTLFTFYLMTGFFVSDKTKTYQSLSLLSGLAPPAYYNFFKPLPQANPVLSARYSSFTKCANNLDCFKDYVQGIEYAKEMQKPVLLDFTGYGCVNCRKTEEHIWVKDEVWSSIAGDFVLISLYCDDETPLGEITYSKIRKKKLRNIGNLWEDFQIVNFQQNSQPLYLAIDPNDQEVLIPSRGYHSSAKAYKEFLSCALQSFKDKKLNLLGATD